MLALLALALLAGGQLLGQTTFATITGTVTDSTGAVIPNADVSATHVATGITTKTQSNEAGVYTLAQLKEGEYVVRVKKSSFKEQVSEKVVVDARANRRLDVVLDLGPVTERVQVTAERGLVDTETPRISDTRRRDELLTLPLRSGAAQAFVSLSPGIKKLTGQAAATFDGSKLGEATWSIDGTNYGDSAQNGWQPMASTVDMLQE
ncbi:MAG: carboxypeptidase-like regulatory domain-containing protein, partial [Gammaproteobacteria bacterium]